MDFNERPYARNHYKDPDPVYPLEKEYDDSKVSPEVKNYVKQLSEKMDGVDTREVLRRAVEIIDLVAGDAKDTSVATKERQDDLERRYDDQIAGNTDIDEVLDARRPEGGEAFPTLRRRLDYEYQLITGRLSQTIVSFDWLDPDKTGEQDSYEKFLEVLNIVKGKSSIVIVSEGDYLIDTNSPIEIPDHVTVIFKGKIIFNSDRTTPVFTIRGKNIGIEGLTADGQFDGSDTYLDNAHVIDIRSAEDVRISDTTVENVRGDAIYLGRDYTAETPKIPKWIYINNTNVHNAKRNGIAITSGRKVYIDGVGITSDESNNWYVSAGVDMEPNNTLEEFEAIEIKNVDIKANVIGGAIWSLVADGKKPRIFKDITWENISVETFTETERKVVFDGGGNADEVLIKNLKLKNTTAQIFNVLDTEVEGVTSDETDKTVLLLNYLKGTFSLSKFVYKSDVETNNPVIRLRNSNTRDVSFNNLSLHTPKSVRGLAVAGEQTLKDLFVTKSLLTGILEVDRTTGVMLQGNIIESFIEPNGNSRVIDNGNLIGGKAYATVGPTSMRPENPPIGWEFFDSSLNVPIWWNGTEWVRVDEK